MKRKRNNLKDQLPKELRRKLPCRGTFNLDFPKVESMDRIRREVLSDFCRSCSGIVLKLDTKSERYDLDLSAFIDNPSIANAKGLALKTEKVVGGVLEEMVLSKYLNEEEKLFIGTALANYFSVGTFIDVLTEAGFPPMMISPKHELRFKEVKKGKNLEGKMLDLVTSGFVGTPVFGTGMPSRKYTPARLEVKFLNVFQAMREALSTNDENSKVYTVRLNYKIVVTDPLVDL